MPPQHSFKKELKMKHSETTISQLLHDINIMNEEINNTVLIGERCGMIYDASHVYNRLKSLITPEYLSDEEYNWLREIGTEWNKTMAEYAKGQNSTMQKNGSSPESIEDIEDALKEALDDLMNNIDDFTQDNGGFDGGDGIW